MQRQGFSLAIDQIPHKGTHGSCVRLRFFAWDQISFHSCAKCQQHLIAQVSNFDEPKDLKKSMLEA